MNSLYGGRDSFKGRRELIFVVEASKALQPHWPRIKDHYITNIVRNPYEDRCITNIGLVVFTSHNCACLVRRSFWARTTLDFLNWLEDMCFYDVDGAATAEGLAEALLMFSDVATHRNFGRKYSPFYQKHCVLIASTSPSNYHASIPKLASQIYEENNFPETLTEQKKFYKVGDVAKIFAQCFISLSVISPTRCSLFKNLFNMAKRDFPVTEPDFEDADSPDKFLLLLSEYFVEAHLALNRYRINYFSMYQAFMTSKRPKLLKKESSKETRHSEKRSVIRTTRTFGSITSPIVKVEPKIGPFDAPRPFFSDVSAHSVYRNGQSLPSSASQNPTFGNGLCQEVKPLISGTQVHYAFGTQFSFRLWPYVLPPSLQRTGFLKVWEGYLSGDFLGLHVHSRFEGYKSAGASEPLANDWPFIMQIMCHVDNSTLEKCVYASAFIEQCIGKAEIVCFRKLDQPKLLFNRISTEAALLFDILSLILNTSRRTSVSSAVALSHLAYSQSVDFIVYDSPIVLPDVLRLRHSDRKPINSVKFRLYRHR